MVMDHQWLQSQFKINPDKTKADLARALKLDAPAISKILAGTRQIKAAEYVAMRRFFGLPTDGAGFSAQGNDKSRYVIGALDGAMSETAQNETDQDAWIMPARLFENRTAATAENIKIFTAQEDAMQPDIMAGEHIVVDLSVTKPSPAGIFLLSDGVGQIIRQCEFVAHSDPPQIKVSARLDKYDSYIIEYQRVEMIGRVIAKLQWL